MAPVAHMQGVTLSSPPHPDPERDALFLDFDGTLVPLEDRPDAVTVPASLIAMLHELADRLEGRIAIVSGRAIEVLDRFGLSGLALAGSHGAEWRLPRERHEMQPRPASLDLAAAAFRAFAARHDGVIYEDKPLGTALHFRLAPDMTQAAIALAQQHAADLHLQHGHAMIELRVAGVDKGTALAMLMERAPFAGYRPLFFGDDVTDETGFAVAARLGGHGVLVGAVRDTRASYALPDPAAVNAWLARIAEPATSVRNLS